MTERNQRGQIQTARLSPSLRGFLLEQETRTLPHLDVIAAELASLSPSFHFTTQRFRYHPDNNQSSQLLAKYAQEKQWRVTRHPEYLEITTDYVDRIREQGLLAGTYVAAFSPSNWKLISGKGSLLVLAAQNLIRDFSKHAMPYKHPVFGTKQAKGYVSNVEAGVVVLKGDAPLNEIKNEQPARALTNQTILRPATYVLSNPVESQAIHTIIPITIQNGARVDNQQLRMRFDILHTQVARGLLGSLPQLIPEYIMSSADLKKITSLINAMQIS